MHLPAPAHWQTSMESNIPSRAADELFPLRLTPFEEYMYLDHLAGNSMVFCVRFEVEGTIERAAFEQALRQTAADNPLIRATIRRRWWGRYDWTLEPAVQPSVCWEEAANYSYHVPPLDLRSEAGVRIVVVRSGEVSQINMFMHHAVGDGLCFDSHGRD